MSSNLTGKSTAWSKHFPKLAESDDKYIHQVFNSAKLLSFPEHVTVSAIGSTSENYVLVTKGCIRIQVLTDGGREVVLYRVHPGEGCVLTTACLLSGEPFMAEGVTESPTEILAISSPDFDKTLHHSETFRRFVFSSIGQKLSDVMTRIEQLCSPSIDRHLAGLLHEFISVEGNPVEITHQELALELGTAREVVSRHLKQFESNGWVQLGRGTIQIKKPENLARLSGK